MKEIAEIYANKHNTSFQTTDPRIVPFDFTYKGLDLTVTDIDIRIKWFDDEESGSGEQFRNFDLVIERIEIKELQEDGSYELVKITDHDVDRLTIELKQSFDWSELCG